MRSSLSLRFGIAALVVAGSLVLGSTPARADVPTPSPCGTSVLPHGALALVCVPANGWNGDLVVFAHGYVRFDEPLGFYNLDLPDGTTLPQVVQRLGYAFATTSYRQNGLAILEGADDVVELVLTVDAVVHPARVYLVGGSEGGLVTTLLMERVPQLFTGGVAACGPIGSFRGQIDYVGDFRVLFDALFPGVLPGSATRIPPELMANWDTVYEPAVVAALAADPIKTFTLIRMSRAAVDPAEPATVARTTTHLLWYSVFGTNDAAAKLGGNPFDNSARHYTGSGNLLVDLLVNLAARRYHADAAALAALARYETAGVPLRPLVAPHTTGDEVIPFWHELRYAAKLAPGAPYVLLPVPRYGHCTFTATELLASFALLVQIAGR